MPRKVKRKIGVLDTETDPFKYGRIPEPFCAEFYSDEITLVFWGDDCITKMCEALAALPDSYIIYAHNGGKFDYHFMHEYINNPALIIKSRITSARLFHHELRDSFSIIPVGLAQMEKMKFDYNKMERPVREKNKAEILEYLHSDCINLYGFVVRFIADFGLHMTIGGTAIKELMKVSPFIKQGSRHDESFRSFYYGGRVQCFSSGINDTGYKCYDVNSMYPSVMRNRLHPINGGFEVSESMPNSFDRPFFIEFCGTNRNALPSLDENGNLDFTKAEGLFKACSHELEVALKYNLCTIDKVIKCYTAIQSISFIEFVDKFYSRKVAAKERGDKEDELFSKLILNSAYGRCGINPKNFEDWIIHRDFGNEQELIDGGYKETADFETIELWSKPAQILERHYCDVSIAASITSAARAVLLEGLALAENPIYCDTDSIICTKFNGDVDKYKLGAWDLEASSQYVAIAGKKLYAMYDDENGKSIKLASKGGTITLKDIIGLCRGESINYENVAPTFSLKKKPSFVTRTFNSTVDASPFRA